MNSDDLIETTLDLLHRVPRPSGYRIPGGVVGDVEIEGFEERTGLVVPAAMRRWLAICNGALAGPGGLYGIRPRDRFLDIEDMFEMYPIWKDLGAIPIAGDGCGNYYLLVTAGDMIGYVGFVEPIVDDGSFAYYAASSIWHFLAGVLSDEVGEEWWPFDEERMSEYDPDLARLPQPLLPWGR